MTLYVPGTQEKDLSKVILSLQQVSGQTASNTTSIASNTTSIANNTASISAIQAAWTAYTPTVTAQFGTITAYTATGRYKQIGKTVLVQTDVTITTVGTASGGMRVSLPFTAANFNYDGCSREIANTGKSGSAVIIAGTSNFDARDSTGATYLANTNEIVCSVIYEVP